MPDIPTQTSDEAATLLMNGPRSEFRTAVAALLRQELDQHEADLAKAEAEFAEYDNHETMHQIDILEGQVSLLHDLVAKIEALPAV